jgi:hypothetical protein
MSFHVASAGNALGPLPESFGNGTRFLSYVSGALIAQGGDVVEESPRESSGISVRGLLELSKRFFVFAPVLHGFG